MILALGGGICAGARVYSAWPERLSQMLGEPVVNAGLPGGRLIDCLRGLPSARLLSVTGSPRAVVIQPGPNDAKGGGPPPKEWLAVLTQTVHNIADVWPEARILVCQLCPIERENGAPGYGRDARRWVDRTNEALITWADEAEVALIPLGAPASRDGVHPSSGGHGQIAEAVLTAVGFGW